MADIDGVNSLMPTFRTLKAQAAFLGAYDRELSSWAVPVEERDVTTDFGATHVLSFGDTGGRPFVLLHWLASNSNLWKEMAPYLAAEFRVHAIDILGDMGKSVASKTLASEREIAEWVGQVLDSLGLRKPMVGGLSNGGFHAAVFALLRPDRVERLVLMAPAGTLRPIGVPFAFSALSTVLNPNDRAIERFKSTWSFRNNSWSEDFTSMIACAFRAGRIQPKVFPRRFKDAELASLTMPTLVLLGERDTIYSPRKAAERAKRLLPCARVVLLKDCDHAIPIDVPEAAARAVKEFVAS